MRTKATLLMICIFSFTLLVNLATAQQNDKAKSKSGGENKMTAKQPQQVESPFFCSLTALNAAERSRHKDLGKELRTAVNEIRELPEGYAFRLPGERQTIAMVAEWVSLERLCCPFFTFQLEIGSDPNPIWLRITGKEGVKQFMQSEFGIKQ
jgi:hypothetical protein